MTIEITSLEDLRNTVAAWRQAGDRIALVPTMGALHAGHRSLIEAAKAQAARVVVSIFVNPTQFGPNEDFERYPRPLAEDRAALHAAGADMLWLPSVATIYPEGFATRIHIAGLSKDLEGQFRPGHFDGVATVVAKLLNQVTPEYALFGEKDYQQLCVIQRLVNDLNIPTTIIPVPTLRETDGLALSSRNQYLSAEQRLLAPRLYQILLETGNKIVRGGVAPDILHEARQMLKKAGFGAVDYLDLRTEDTFMPPAQPLNAPARLLVAAWLANTRLIDNIRVVPSGITT